MLYVISDALAKKETVRIMLNNHVKPPLLGDAATAVVARSNLWII